MNILHSQADVLSLGSKSFPRPLLRFASELLQSVEAEVDLEDREAHLLRNPVILCDPRDQIVALLEAKPYGYEYVERLDLEGVVVFRAGVLLDNDWFVQYLIPTDGIDSETAKWLDEHATTGGDV